MRAVMIFMMWLPFVMVSSVVGMMRAPRASREEWLGGATFLFATLILMICAVGLSFVYFFSGSI